MVNTKRVYEKPKKNDGYRILVDRLWPRGLKKDEVKIDLWLKNIAPSDELRQWFGHDPKKWLAFERKYFREKKNGSRFWWDGRVAALSLCFLGPEKPNSTMPPP